MDQGTGGNREEDEHQIFWDNVHGCQHSCEMKRLCAEDGMICKKLELSEGVSHELTIMSKKNHVQTLVGVIIAGENFYFVNSCNTTNKKNKKEKNGGWEGDTKQMLVFAGLGCIHTPIVRPCNCAITIKKCLKIINKK